MTKILTMGTARKVVNDAIAASELGDRFHTTATASRRDVMVETVEYCRDAYTSDKATAAENLAAFNACWDIVVDDIVSANETKLRPGFNVNDDGNARYNELLLMWRQKGERPVLTASASRDLRAIREALSKDGKLPALCEAWLKTKNFNPNKKAPKKPAIKFSVEELVSIMMIEKSLTKDEAEKIVAKYVKAKAA